MSSSLAARGNSIIRVTGVDLSASLGKLVKFANGAPAANGSATVPATGIVLDGNIATAPSSVGILGGLSFPVRVQISATANPLKQGDTIQQAADDTFTNDAGAGNARVVAGVITDPNGAAAGDLAEALLFAPQIRA